MAEARQLFVRDVVPCPAGLIKHVLHGAAEKRSFLSLPFELPRVCAGLELLPRDSGVVGEHVGIAEAKLLVGVAMEASAENVLLRVDLTDGLPRLIQEDELLSYSGNGCFARHHVLAH